MMFLLEIYLTLIVLKLSFLSLPPLRVLLTFLFGSGLLLTSFLSKVLSWIFSVFDLLRCVSYLLMSGKFSGG